MKWLKSTSNLTYTVEGKTIPAMTGKPLAVEDSFLEVIKQNKVIASLIRNGGVIVLDKYTDSDVVNSDAEKQLQAQQALIQSLQNDLAKAKASAAKASVSDEEKDKAAKFDELKAEAEKALADKDAEIAALKAQLSKSKSKTAKQAEEE